MATAGEIIELALDTVQDNAFEDRCLTFLNNGIGAVAGFSRFRLPELLVVSEPLVVTGGIIKTPLPVNYSKNLYMAYDENGNRVDIHRGSLFTFMRKFPTRDTGSEILIVAVNGSIMYSYPKCSEDKALSITYLRKPTILSESDDVTEIPEPYATKLLEAYVCKECFTRIEDGVEGRKINTEYWGNEFNTAVGELGDFLGLIDTEPEYVFDELSL